MKKNDIYEKLIKAANGAVVCAAKAHPEKIDITMVNSIAKRVVGQLLNKFDFAIKQVKPDTANSINDSVNTNLSEKQEKDKTEC